MKAKFKVNNEFRLKKDHTFTRTFPIGGYNKDGSVGEADKVHRKVGSMAKVSQCVFRSSLTTDSA